MVKHFELTDRFIVNDSGVKLFQIKCTRDIKWAKVGDLGGWIESEINLSDNAWVSGNAQVYGNAWVFGNACVFGNAQVSGNAQVYGNACVFSNAWVSDDAQVYGNARVYGDAQVYGNAQVSGNARVYGNNQHCGFDCFGSQNRHTHAYMTKSGEVEITCGCFIGSIQEFEQKVHETHKGTIYERQYMAMIELIKIKFGLK